MFGFIFKNTGITAFCLLCVLSQMFTEGSVVRLAQLGQSASLPCPYHYENYTNLSELSVQWRSPQSALLCHFVKHKRFQNCSEGYSISYKPANISLNVRQVRDRDYGTHLCSVSKRHEFTDSQVQLVRLTEPVTVAPGHSEALSAHGWTLLLSVSVSAWF